MFTIQLTNHAPCPQFLDWVDDFDSFDEAKVWALTNLPVFEDEYGKEWRIVGDDDPGGRRELTACQGW